MPPTTITPAPAPAPPPVPVPAPVSLAPPPIETPDGIDIKIDDVNKSLKDYIIHKRLLQFIAAVVGLIVWEGILVPVFVVSLFSTNSDTNSGSNGKGIATLVIMPIVFFTAWIARIKAKFEAAFLAEFARANDFTFNLTGTVDETYGTIFRINGKQAVSDIITGTYRGNDLRLFLYKLTVRQGRSSVTRTDTVIELDLHGQLPNLLMVNKQSNYNKINIEESFGTKNKIQLEGDFEQFFTLYAPSNTQIEALEVFSPDTMALMEDESRHYTVEFAANRIYIYANNYITTTQQLTEVFALAKKLIDKIAPVAARLTNDSAVFVPPVNLAQGIPSARSLKITKRLTTIIVVVVIFMVVFIAGISIINALIINK